MDDAPVIVTLALDEASQARFDELRQRHFPPERNHLAAHVTLFHALPGALLASLLDDVREVARRPPFPLRVTGVRSLGRGAAYALEAPELQEVHRELAGRWRELLTPQDRQPLRAHVTVQNKVAPKQARATLAQLAAQPLPPDAEALGLALWHYRGGPWQAVQTVGFSG